MCSSVSSEGSQERNELLADLPAPVRHRLQAALQPQLLIQGEIICKPGQQLEWLYFPTTAVVSVINLLADGASDELAVVGAEGAVGIPLILGARTKTATAVVRSSGWACRLRRAILTEELARGGAFQERLLRYVQSRYALLGQLAVCNRHHSTVERLCRQLLLHLDRNGRDELAATHEWLAERLGVRRESITEALGALQKAGLLRYHRGRMLVLDRPGIEASACECYGVVRRESARLVSLGARRSLAPFESAMAHV
jgi:CRP-like cAMP-binding protein